MFFIGAASRTFNRLSLVLPQARAMQVREAQGFLPKELNGVAQSAPGADVQCLEYNR